MNPTRRQKNQALASANLLLAPVMIYKLFWLDRALGWPMLLWMLALGPVVLAVMMTPASHPRAKAIHMALFLLTGTAIGLTMGAVFSPKQPVLIFQILWLPIGIAAAVLHYWPSDRDRYFHPNL